jgi:hypothetical protein
VRRFRLQQRETCPESLSIIKGEFVRDVIGGRCLIEDTIESADADVVLSISEPPVGRSSYQNLLRNDPCKGGAVLSRIEDGPTTVIILERRGDRMIPAEAKTTLVAQYAAMPLHFRPVFRGLNSCLVTASDPFPANFADPYEMIGRRYHLPIAKAPDSDRLSAISAVPFSDGDRTLVKAILERDASAHLSKTESRLVASFVNTRLKSGKLNDDDIELIRALLKQHGFTAPIETRLPPSTYQALKLLLPGMFERVAYRADEQSQIVQSLDQMLDHFPAEDIDPYLATLCGGGKNGDLRVCYMREFRTGHKN